MALLYPFPAFAALSLAALSLAALSLAGCGATGLDWVREPESGGARSSSEDFDLPNPPSRAVPTPAPPRVAAAAAAPLPDDEPVPRYRIDRVISLGESVDSVAVGSRDGDAARGPAAGSPVIVNIYNDVNVTPAYGGFTDSGGFDRPFRHRGRSTRRSAPATPRVGGDWPAVPSAGPPFPYKTAPASPWLPAR